MHVPVHSALGTVWCLICARYRTCLSGMAFRTGTDGTRRPNPRRLELRVSQSRVPEGRQQTIVENKYSRGSERDVLYWMDSGATSPAPTVSVMQMARLLSNKQCGRHLRHFRSALAPWPFAVSHPSYPEFPTYTWLTRVICRAEERE